MSPDSLLPWILFNLFILAMLLLDLGIFHRKPHAISLKEALSWSLVWISLALFFNVAIYFWRGEELATAFLASYLIEKSLSVDNIFVFLTIFSFFKIPMRFQHKILFWGILGALVMRGFFIFLGVALIQKFHWVTYILGALLIGTAVKMLKDHGNELRPDCNVVVRIFRRFFPVVVDVDSGKFFIRQGGRLKATTLFISLLVVEISDLIFAVDSIPAILAITSDSFIVYTSNVFAILGLRSLYFAIAGAVTSLAYLHYGLVMILTFVGGKMLVSGFYKIPVEIALLVIAGILSLSVGASLLLKPIKPKK